MAAADQEPAPEEYMAPAATAAVVREVPDEGNGTPDAAAAATDPSTGGGPEGRDESGDQDNEAEEAGGISDGDFDENDLVQEEDGEDELDSKLKPDHRFFAVRALVEGGKTARKLNRRLKPHSSKDDGFLVKGDERLYRNFNDSSIERRVNMSASFQYNGTCHTCLNGPHDAWQGRDGQPVVVVAGDHHFPANIPARGDGECIKILRVENGSLAEITGELVRMSPRGGGGSRYGRHAWVRCDAGD